MKNKVKFFLIFDAGSKELVFTTTHQEIIDKVDKEFVLIKEIFLGSEEEYVGDYDDGKVVNVYNKPVIDERFLKTKNELEKNSLYPIEERIKIILEVLKNNESIIKTENFNNMVSTLDKMDNTLRVKLNAMKKNQKNLTIYPYDKEVYLSLKLNDYTRK